MCTNLVLILKNEIFAKLNRMKMVVVSCREFRANQRKYLDLALTDDVVITSRSRRKEGPSHNSRALTCISNL